jgi:copper chaperone NosL
MKTTTALTALSRLLLAMSAILLAISLFVPVWRIDLDAPQYPEGLRLLIFANKLGGNVDIINGLNHYIGMKTLHTEDFVEFTILPYIIGSFALLSLAVCLVGRKKLLYGVFTIFVLFGIIAMADFWRWEYNYGHNLDPNAAIIVPGMAYQPPLIGFKQLLNFGAYSVPSTGGWLFIISGALMLFAVLNERGVLSRFSRKKSVTALVILLILSGCTGTEPQPVKLNEDQCEYCKMTISNDRFAAELITRKGRVYKFDDYACMHNYISENEKAAGSALYVSDYLEPRHLIESSSATFIQGGSISSPMGGNMAAFSDADSAKAYGQKKGAKILPNN